MDDKKIKIDENLIEYGEITTKTQETNYSDLEGGVTDALFPLPHLIGK